MDEAQVQGIDIDAIAVEEQVKGDGMEEEHVQDGLQGDEAHESAVESELEGVTEEVETGEWVLWTLCEGLEGEGMRGGCGRGGNKGVLNDVESRWDRSIGLVDGPQWSG